MFGGKDRTQGEHGHRDQLCHPRLASPGRFHNSFLPTISLLHIPKPSVVLEVYHAFPAHHISEGHGCTFSPSASHKATRVPDISKEADSNLRRSLINSSLSSFPTSLLFAVVAVPSREDTVPRVRRTRLLLGMSFLQRRFCSALLI